MARFRLSVLVFSVTTSALAAQGNNLHVFYSPQKTQFATRGTTTDDDQVLFTQPRPFHYNSGRGMGWQLVLQDQNQATAELVTLSFHGVQADQVTPQTAPITTAQFLLFGVGTGGSAFLYTLTTPHPINLATQLALGVLLPKPHPWSTDAVLLHYQRGDNTLVPLAKRIPATYLVVSGVPTLAWVIGSVFHWGAVYDDPVLRCFARKATESLYGPEALFPLIGAGDKLGLEVSGDRFKSLATQSPSFACLFISTGYGASPVLTPYGPILWDTSNAQNFLCAQTSLTGNVAVPPMALPPTPIQVALQAGLANLMTNELKFSNAILIQTQP